MKQEILCIPCYNSIRAILPHYWQADSGYQPPSPTPGEAWRSLEGTALSPRLCDHCNAPLPEGTQIVCLSIYSDANPYFEWEHNFVK